MSAFRPSTPDPKPSKRETTNRPEPRRPTTPGGVGVYDRPDEGAGVGRSWNTFTKVIVILIAILIAVMLFIWIL